MQLIDPTQLRSSPALFLRCSRAEKTIFSAAILHVTQHKILDDIAVGAFRLTHVNHAHNFVTRHASLSNFSRSCSMYAYSAWVHLEYIYPSSENTAIFCWQHNNFCLSPVFVIFSYYNAQWTLLFSLEDSFYSVTLMLS